MIVICYLLMMHDGLIFMIFFFNLPLTATYTPIIPIQCKFDPILHRFQTIFRIVQNFGVMFTLKIRFQKQQLENLCGEKLRNKSLNCLQLLNEMIRTSNLISLIFQKSFESLFDHNSLWKTLNFDLHMKCY